MVGGQTCPNEISGAGLVCVQLCVWACVVVQKYNTLRQHSSPFVFNGSAQFFQSFTICF